MKTFLGLECSEEINNIRSIQFDLVVFKMVPLRQIVIKRLAGSVIMANPGGFFSHLHKQLPRLKIVIFSERFFARLAF